MRIDAKVKRWFIIDRQVQSHIYVEQKLVSDKLFVGKLYSTKVLGLICKIWKCVGSRGSVIHFSYQSLRRACFQLRMNV